MVKKKKRKTISQLHKKLWPLVSQFVRLSEADEFGMISCYTCDKRKHYKKMHCSHLFSKGGHPNTKYDNENLRVCCAGCNMFLHGNLIEFTLRLQNEIGTDKVDALRIRARTAKKWRRDELEDLIVEYKQKVAEMNLEE